MVCIGYVSTHARCRPAEQTQGLGPSYNITKAPNCRHPRNGDPASIIYIYSVRFPMANRSIDADSCLDGKTKTVPNPLLARPAFHVGWVNLDAGIV